MSRSNTYLRDIVKEFLEEKVAFLARVKHTTVEERKTMQALACFNQLIIQEPQTTKQDERYRAAAREEYAREGAIEIDDDATISYGDEAGAYVQAWVWVSKPKRPVRQKFPSGD